MRNNQAPEAKRSNVNATRQTPKPETPGVLEALEAWNAIAGAREIPVRDRGQSLRSVPLEDFTTEDDMVDLLDICDRVGLKFLDVLGVALRREILRQAALFEDYRRAAVAFDSHAWERWMEAHYWPPIAAAAQTA